MQQHDAMTFIFVLDVKKWLNYVYFCGKHFGVKPLTMESTQVF